MSIASLNDANVTAVDGCKRRLVDGVLPRPQPKVDPRCERVGLQTGFAVERDDRAVGECAVLAKQYPLLVQNADLLFRDNDSPKENAQH